MSSRPASLTDIERVTGLIGDVVDQLESLQAIGPRPELEPVIGDARFARDSLARITAAHLDALEEFVREHGPEEGGEIPF